MNSCVWVTLWSGTVVEQFASRDLAQLMVFIEHLKFLSLDVSFNIIECVFRLVFNLPNSITVSTNRQHCFLNWNCLLNFLKRRGFYVLLFLERNMSFSYFVSVWNWGTLILVLLQCNLQIIIYSCTVLKKLKLTFLMQIVRMFCDNLNFLLNFIQNYWNLFKFIRQCQNLKSL